ncbi:hypothetical protein B0H67DRAFT_525941 [Lasiosphaeris hirsuta]|uniref:Amine oxidase domain-containing protein n=1 Tax=Lasiosphaeris hirsuta TaxID=260670 RepID=A0AA40BDM7_9PEZI|nr:hypothetical protein B0H67DRAFT_525941 [Lasiosphaeris hirsuta]
MACAKLRKSTDFAGLIPGIPGLPNDFDLNPEYPPPGLGDLNFDEIIKSCLPQPVEFDIGVIGAGMAGLYTSLILQDLDLKHEVVEASHRPGGRVQTHRFSQDDGDYFEVGAMLFPDIPIMSRTFKLLKLLEIEKDMSADPKLGCLIPYHFSGPNNPMFFNNILVKVGGDRDGDGCGPGVHADGPFNAREILKRIFDYWKTRLVYDFESGWQELMELDSRAISLKMYMVQELQNEYQEHAYELLMTNGEYRGTGHFDASFVSWVLLSLEFQYPAPDRENAWWILNGGSDLVAEGVVKRLKKKPLYKHMVTGISRNEARDKMVVTMRRGQTVKPITKDYTHVITTTTAPCLGFMDLGDAGLTDMHREAIRTLHYDNVVKLGIKFRRRWWAEDNRITRGGTGMTDRPTRIVVYPSHALNTPEGQPGVLYACYNWGQDAARLGGLSVSSEATSQVAIFDAVMQDLAVMHECPEEELRGMVVEYYVHDWNRDRLTNGHFALLAPGQFASYFGNLQRPAAMGRLFLAGEMASIYHGWIVGALDSAYCAIFRMLAGEMLRHLDNWGALNYLYSKLQLLRSRWGSAEGEPESECCVDLSLKGLIGWQVFLGMCDGNERPGARDEAL